MRFLLSIAVTLSFLAGQSCNAHAAVFYPLKNADGPLMSRMVTRCAPVDTEQVSPTAKDMDCAHDKCVADSKGNAEPAACTLDQPVVYPPVTVAFEVPADILIDHADTIAVPSSDGRPFLIARRE